MKASPLPLLRTSIALTLLAQLSAASDGSLSMPAVFGDHMVLQRESTAPFWGKAAPGETISLSASWTETQVSTTADGNGDWHTELPTPAAGGPYEVTVQGSDSLRFADVLIGEVWICSGQSNMEFPMAATDRAADDLAAAEHARIRIFDVGHRVAQQPVFEVEGHWAACTPQSIANFSAVAYFFGQDLEAALDVPIGLIGTNWGGTPAESWTSREGIAPLHDFDAVLARIDESAREGSQEKSLADRQAEWWRGLEGADPGYRGAWMRPGWNTEDWSEAPVPGYFRDAGLGDFDGCLWYRRVFDLPADWSDPELVLELGPIDDMDIVWLNGEPVGSTKRFGLWQSPREYHFPSRLAHVGRNELVVCVVDTGGAGSLGVAGGAPTPMRLRRAGVPEGAGVALEGNWHLKQGAPMSAIGAYPSGTWFNQNSATSLYNGMLAPLIPYSIRGAIWYQGESNRDRHAQYRVLFPAMIQDWRAHWGRGDFPFYFVQIAPFQYGGDSGQAALLREAQTMTLSLANTGMAVTMDVGNPLDIHPRDKHTVGHRLALWALSQTYGQEQPHSGPLYERMQREGQGLRLHFRHVAGHLVARGGPLTHFTLAGADRVFHQAEARIDGETVFVQSAEVPEPVALRYAWGAADEPNLANAAGLPAPSFRTDTW